MSTNCQLDPWEQASVKFKSNIFSKGVCENVIRSIFNQYWILLQRTVNKPIFFIGEVRTKIRPEKNPLGDGRNGLDPPTSFRVIQLYVVTRLLQGLEATCLLRSDIQALGTFLGSFYARYRNYQKVLLQRYLPPYRKPANWSYPW